MDKTLPQEADIPTSENETFEEINILMLGETGVGKSTFINAFVNYLKFEKLSEAKEGELDVLIASKFTVMDDNYEMKSIKIGDDDPNELTDNNGTSSTQGCTDYEFAMESNALVRLIDTPGIGDTRGLKKDEENFENILKYISRYKHLNGICILLKPNSARLTVVFRFCIQELLSHLHRSAKDNIVFCFTNSRTTFYRPGETLVPLRKQLDELTWRYDRKFCRISATEWVDEDNSVHITLMPHPKKGANYMSLTYRSVEQAKIDPNTLAVN